MFWEEMTSDQFEIALKESEETCIFPFGVIEKHGSHLPLNTDMLIAREVASEAAKLEPTVIYPYYNYGQINEARHTPGTISMKPEMEYALLERVFDEIYRNGFRKIVILSSHGGNTSFVNYFMQGHVHRGKEYLLYNIDHHAWYTAEQKQELMELMGLSSIGDHAGSVETAFIMAIRPDLVHMGKVNPEGAIKQGRLDHLGSIATPVSWYADHPTHQMGDPAPATTEIGRKLISYASENIAKMLSIIKKDKTAGELQKEFFLKSNR